MLNMYPHLKKRAMKNGILSRRCITYIVTKSLVKHHTP